LRLWRTFIPTWHTSNQNERSKLYINIPGSNYALLNCCAKKAAAKCEEHAGTRR